MRGQSSLIGGVIVLPSKKFQKPSVYYKIESGELDCEITSKNCETK